MGGGCGHCRPARWSGDTRENRAMVGAAAAILMNRGVVYLGGAGCSVLVRGALFGCAFCALFGDSGHWVAAQLNGAAKKKPPQPQPACCIQKGFYWDEAILYPPHGRWRDAPASIFWSGPVFRIIPGPEKALTEEP